MTIYIYKSVLILLLSCCLLFSCNNDLSLPCFKIIFCHLLSESFLEAVLCTSYVPNCSTSCSLSARVQNTFYAFIKKVRMTCNWCICSWVVITFWKKCSINVFFLHLWLCRDLKMGDLRDSFIKERFEVCNI